MIVLLFLKTINRNYRVSEPEDYEHEMQKCDECGGEFELLHTHNGSAANRRQGF